jgi:hypothetical protein
MSRNARITDPSTNEIKKNSNGSELRSFMCVSVNGKEFESRAQKTSPNLAAGSIFSQWIKTQKVSNEIKGLVILRESTRGGLKKEYKYTVTRTKLDKPLTLPNGITVKYNTNIVSQNLD